MIIVSGLPRSGSSMMMQILEKGGLKPITDGRKKPTNANPKGFYEFGGMEFKPEWWVDEGKGDCIKVLIPQVKQLGDRKVKYIFMMRNMEEIANSFNRMHRADIWAMSHLRSDTLKWLKDKDVIYLNYNRIMENPRSELEKIKDLIPNFEQALKAIDPKLYRIKKESGSRMITEEDLKNRKKQLQLKIKKTNSLLKQFTKLNKKEVKMESKEKISKRVLELRQEIQMHQNKLIQSQQAARIESEQIIAKQGAILEFQKILKNDKSEKKSEKLKESLKKAKDLNN